MMTKNHFFVTGNDTSMLRHEKQIEEEVEVRGRTRSVKQKKIIVTITAKDSDTINEVDVETMDLNKKEQENTQLCRIMHQKARKEDGM